MAGRTLVDLFDERVATSGDAVALRHPVGGALRTVTWSEWLRDATVLAAGLSRLGVGPGDRVGLLSRTRMEWVVADQAILRAGGVVVPLYPNILPGQTAIILADAGASVVFVEDPSQLEKLLAVRDRIPTLRHVVWLDRVAELDSPDRQGRSIIRLDDIEGYDPDDPFALDIGRLRELGAEAIGDDANIVLDRRRRLAPTDVASIVYTSGTTGRPRGAVLTHDNFVAEVTANALAVPLTEDDEQLLFLPLSHIFARIAYLTSVQSGSVTTFSKGLRSLPSELQSVRPTLIVGVPRVFEKIYARILARASGNAVRARAARALVALAVRRSEALAEGREPGLADRLQLAVAERTLFRQVRAVFGGRLRFAVSGGAPLSTDLGHFFTGAGVPILEGYGLTENCAAATVNRFGHARIGTVGQPLDGVQLRIADDGEILIRGRNVMQGYWQDADATDAVLVDGWLHTGDIGEIDGDGFLRVTDRKKDIIITAGGKNIAPLPIETALQTIPWVERAIVHGDRRKYLTALLTLRRDVVQQWASDNGMDDEAFDTLCQHPRIYELVRQAVDEVNRDLPGVETIKRFAILDEEFDPASGEVTATWKSRRGFISKKYADVLDALYDDPSTAMGRPPIGAAE